MHGLILIMTNKSNKQSILELQDVSAVYGRLSLALKGVSLIVPEGSIVALLGANGAGKTTTLKSISNLISIDGGTVSRGKILYKDENIAGVDPITLVSKGIVQVLEGRRCFSHLTVEENLLVSCKRKSRSRLDIKNDIEEIFEYFPALQKRRRSYAGYISGGEQQMLVIGRALLAKPRMLLLDEPSMGVAPIIVEEIYEILSKSAEKLNFSILLAEQNTRLALSYSSYGYIIGNGRVVMEGTSDELSNNPIVQEFYMGVHEDNKILTKIHSTRTNNWMM